MEEKAEPNFEELLKELEETVASLEDNVSLDDALKLFERGMELSASCEGYLTKAKQKIERLLQTAKGEFDVAAIEVK